GGFADPYLEYPGGNPFPALNEGWRNAPFPAFGLYVNPPRNMEPTQLQQWNVSVQRQLGDWMASASYLGNRSIHLWRGGGGEPRCLRPPRAARPGNANQRPVLFLKNPTQGQFYGTIGQVDDTGRGGYNAVLMSLQRRLKNGFSGLGNWRISKCMSDRPTTKIPG